MQAAGLAAEALQKLASLDIQLLQWLNSFVGASSLGDKLILLFCNNNLVRGLFVFFPLAWMLFSPDETIRRKLLAGFSATCFAVVLSAWIQHHFSGHLRPMLDPSLHVKLVEAALAENWNRNNSFPSDSATLFGGLTATLAAVSAIWGLVGGVWAFITVGIFRIVVGFHFPSDIVAGWLLGWGCVRIALSYPFINMFDAIYNLFARKPFIIPGLMFIFLADAFSLFQGAQGLIFGVKDALMLLAHHS